MNEALISQLLKAWASHLPGIIAFVAALIVIMVKWQQAPRASLLAFFGVLLNLLLAIIMPAIYVWLPQTLLKGSAANNSETLGRMYLVLGILSSVLYALGLLLVVAAVYVDRRKTDTTSRPEFR